MAGGDRGGGGQSGLYKAAQRAIFTYLSTSWGLGLCIGGLFMVAITGFQYGEVS